MKKAILSLAILLSLSFIFTVSCGSNTQPPSGELSAWEIGNTWTTKSVSEYEERTSVKMVIGEQLYNGIDCYIVDDTDTVMEEVSNSYLAFDKTTLMSIGGEYPVHWNGKTKIVNWIVSCDYSVNPYPLSVGKTWTVTGTYNSTDTSIETKESRTTTYSYNTSFEVETIESVTVPVGTFQCFKIVQSYNNGSTIRWVTDLTRGFPVKIITFDKSNIIPVPVEITELVSYSFAE